MLPNQNQKMSVASRHFVLGTPFTAKALHNIARGRERSERTLGMQTNETPTLKGLNNHQFTENFRVFVLWNPFRVRAEKANYNPGWRCYTADPGL